MRWFSSPGAPGSPPLAMPHGLRCNDEKSRDQRRYEQRRTWRYLQKAWHPCSDCGGTFPPESMDFDHRPGEVKRFGLDKLRTISAMRAEIAKCDLVCANCHRARTTQRVREDSHGTS